MPPLDEILDKIITDLWEPYGYGGTGGLDIHLYGRPTAAMGQAALIRWTVRPIWPHALLEF
jgi:hypothetical protein